MAEKQDVFEEMREVFGFVPQWFQGQPPEAVEGFWTLFRDFHLGETRIPNKYKELIGIAVSGATRCAYCTLFHTEAARLQGATDEEINEASMAGAVTMLGSTYLNARQIDYDQFKDETQRIVAYIRQQQGEAQATEEQPRA